MKRTITFTLDRSTLFIGLLSLTSLALLLAVLINPVKAEFAVKDRDYQLVDVPTNVGGDAVYVIDNKTGNAAVFIYDVNRRALVPVAGFQVPQAFK